MADGQHTELQKRVDINEILYSSRKANRKLQLPSRSNTTRKWTKLTSTNSAVSILFSEVSKVSIERYSVEAPTCRRSELKHMIWRREAQVDPNSIFSFGEVLE